MVANARRETFSVMPGFVPRIHVLAKK